MITTNLASLLAERKLKITKVSEDTGISRTTLTALSNGSSQGIQLETMNTLCQFLNVTPEALFIYVPFDIKIEVEQRKYNLYDIRLHVSERGRPTTFILSADVHANVTPSLVDGEVTQVTESIMVFLVSFKYDVTKHTMQSIDEYEAQSKKAFGFLKRLPVLLRVSVEQEIVDRIVDFYHNAENARIYHDFAAIDLFGSA